MRVFRKKWIKDGFSSTKFLDNVSDMLMPEKMSNVNEDRDVCNPEEHKENMSNVNEDRDVCNPENHEENLSNGNEGRDVRYAEQHEDFVGQIINSNSPLDNQIRDITSSGQFSNLFTTSPEISPYYALPFFELPFEIMNDGKVWPPVFDNKQDLEVVYEDSKCQPKDEIIKNSSVENAFTEEQSNSKKTRVECGICFDAYDEILSSKKNLMSTVCGHIFCDDCLKIAFQTKKACPRCRKKLTVRQAHPLFSLNSF
ncbi:hypothetical protein CEXT_107021 [Caerostris extrusa]|uniref:RING-type domain-containing protein n=1 Tax=Caerostris extrusa TaxID=172846 RepID=A0AAV4NJD6_CAEEX|nr:hypothetical protein CEXT_107022 [Caerostris extrusa]GIX84924.1 hypothetical protein CEXT_107021 [Caerostris extrusa]